MKRFNLPQRPALHLPAETDIVYAPTHETHEAIVRSCNTFDFAVVRSVLPATDLAAIQSEGADYARRGQEGDANVASRYSRKDGGYALAILNSRGEEDVQMNTFTPHMMNLIRGLTAAAGRLVSPRMDIGPDFVVTTFVANTFEPGTGIVPHIDNDPGIALAFNLQGVGLATLESKALKNKPVKTVLQPGDLMVLPAQVNGFGPRRQTSHAVANVTPMSDGGGIRRSIAAIYDYKRRTK